VNNHIRDFALLVLPSLCGLALGSESPDGNMEADELGRQLSFQCLRQEKQLDCLNARGFTCEALDGDSRYAYSCYIFIEHGCYRAMFSLTSDGWDGRDEWKLGECE